MSLVDIPFLIIVGMSVDPKFFLRIALVVLVSAIAVSVLLVKNKMESSLLRILGLYSIILCLCSGVGNTLFVWSTEVPEMKEMFMSALFGVMALLAFAPVIALCIGIFLDIRKPKKRIEVFLEVLAACSLFASLFEIIGHFVVVGHPPLGVTLSHAILVWILYAPVIVMGALTFTYLGRRGREQGNGR